MLCGKKGLRPNSQPTSALRSQSCEIGQEEAANGIGLILKGIIHSFAPSRSPYVRLSALIVPPEH
jgi:hypothetical protein